MNPVEIIRKKRDGGTLTREELEFIIGGYVQGDIAEYQMSALLMALYFRGMDFEETALLTDVMLRSGTVVDHSKVPGIKVDKHSTGGVGDKVSIILAPMVAACGVPVPMISGRGLGHSGGTLDKLESIPGFRTVLTLQEYRSVLKEIGVVMMGQTDEIAPADRKMYALRDVTGTIECIPLIAGSIMSKKLAEGIDALVLDIKTGRGAFMQSEDRALALAEMLIAIAKKFGKRAMGFLTDMNQPLGFAVGNWPEIAESLDCLRGREVPDVMELTYVLGGAMLVLGNKAGNLTDGIAKCREAIRSGRAYETFCRLVRRQGGDTTILEHPERYPRSKYMKEIKSSTSGDIGSIDALEVGLVSVMLGAGRTKVDDSVDPKAGIVLKKKVGDSVGREETLAVLYTDNGAVVETSASRLSRAFAIATEPSIARPLIKKVIDEKGVQGWTGYGSTSPS